MLAPILLLSYLALSATAATVTYDTIYDQGTESLDVVACSDGVNGLITRGFTTFASLPSFPRIGGASAVGGWNSTACGTCWQITYTAAGGKNTTIAVTAIDTAPNGFNIALEAMNTLTNGDAVQLGAVSVASEQVAASVCGL